MFQIVYHNVIIRLCRPNYKQPTLIAEYREVQTSSCQRQGRINHSGAPYQRKARALFSYAEPAFSLSSGCTFLLPKSRRLFLVVSVTFRPAYTAYTTRSNVNTAW